MDAATSSVMRTPRIVASMWSTRPRLGGCLSAIPRQPVSWRKKPVLCSSFSPKPFRLSGSNGRKVFWQPVACSRSRIRAAVVALEEYCGQNGSYPPPWFSVAPMMDWTDNHYRTLARLMSSCSWLYTEMIVADTIVHQSENLDRILEYPESQHPIVLQLGGSSPSKLSAAARLASSYGYDEFNFNCGCPSDKVAGAGCFGARLMMDPVLVGRAVSAIAEASRTVVTVKCRIGVDDFDSYEHLCTFISTVSATSPVQHFIVHARKAHLKGLSPAENRSIPPLRYDYVFALVRDFPHLRFTINGGISNVHEVHPALQNGVHGVMFGRAAYNSPWATLGNVDHVVYGKPKKDLTRRQILEEYVKYSKTALGKYGEGRPSVRHLVKPLLHLFHAEPGAKVWKRAVDQCVRVSTSVEDLLGSTLRALPDSVLDASPPNELPEILPFSRVAPLPGKPEFVSDVKIRTRSGDAPIRRISSTLSM